MEEAAGGGQDCGRERSVGIRDGGEAEVAEAAGELIEVFVLFFLCRKDLECGSGGGEDCGGRTALKVVEDGGEREIGECGEDREARLSINSVSDSFVRFFGCSSVKLSCFMVRLSGCSTVRLSGRSSVRISGCSTMRLSGRSSVRLSSSKMEPLHCS